MRELMISKKQGSQTDDLKREVFRLQKDLLQEKTKVKGTVSSFCFILHGSGVALFVAGSDADADGVVSLFLVLCSVVGRTGKPHERASVA